MSIDLKTLPWVDVKSTKRLTVANQGIFDVEHCHKIYVQFNPFGLYNSKKKRLVPFEYNVRNVGQFLRDHADCRVLDGKRMLTDTIGWLAVEGIEKEEK